MKASHLTLIAALVARQIWFERRAAAHAAQTIDELNKALRLRDADLHRWAQKTNQTIEEGLRQTIEEALRP